MELKINDKQKIELDMYDIINEIVSNTPEDRMWGIIEGFMWKKPILKMCSEALAEEFSSNSYNTNIHEARDLFLKHIKQEEIKYYASVIAEKSDNERRHHNSYWKLYHWCAEHEVFKEHGYPPFETPERYDPDWRTKLEQIVEQSLLNKFPELKEGTYCPLCGKPSENGLVHTECADLENNKP